MSSNATFVKLTECVKKTGSKFDDVTCISRLGAHIKFYFVFPGASGNRSVDFFMASLATQQSI